MKKKWFLFDQTYNKASGGANNFLTGFEAFLRDEGLLAEGPTTAEILLFNSFPFRSGSEYWRKLRKIREDFPDLKFIHRIDGPIFLGRRIPRHLLFDKAVNSLSQAFADAIIFQSEWSRRHHEQLFGVSNLLTTVVLNGARQEFSFSEPTNDSERLVVSSSWSTNPNKGHKLLSEISKHIPIDFVGNTNYDIYQGDKHPPIGERALASFLSNYKVFLAPSWDDTCSNSLIEAIESGLTPIARKSGGHPEIVQNADFLFESQSDAITKINNALSGRSSYSKPDLSMKAAGQKYLEFGRKVARMPTKETPFTPPLLFKRLYRFFVDFKGDNFVRHLPLRLDIRLRDRAKLDRGSEIKTWGYKDSLGDKQIASAVREFVERMTVPSQSGDRSRLTLSGDLADDGYLFSTTFAIKTSKIIGSPVPTALLSELRQSMYLDVPFNDKWLSRSSFFSSGAELLTHGKLPSRQKLERVVAQQRQALSALNLWDEMPDSLSIEKYPSAPEKLNWSYPWSAAAQVSHRVFMNANFKEEPRELNKLLMDELSFEIRDFIRKPNSSREQGVNALMKAVTASRSCNMDLDLDPHEILDLTLKHATQDHACNHLNALLVLDYFSSKSPSYRVHEVAKYATDQREKILGHYWGFFGGFSFYRTHSQHTYLGVRVGHGYQEPDMHGTLMFTWGLSIIESLMSKHEPQVFQVINS